MGGCCSTSPPRTDEDRVISSLMAKEVEQEMRTVRVLILGSGDSGKSTLVKQMRKIYLEVTESERQAFASSIREAMAQYIKSLCTASIEFADMRRPQCAVRNVDLTEWAAEFASPMCAIELTPDCLSVMKGLWEDEGIQQTFALRNEFSLATNVPYFFERIDEIVLDTYVPTWDDYIRFRMRTTGHTEETFPVPMASIRDLVLKVTDVGGQKAERKKWMHLFMDANIHGVIYVLGANGYDTVLFEDTTQNRWRDSLRLFGTLAKTHMFDLRTVIIFFNKYDLFKEKIKDVPVTVEFSEEFEADAAVSDPTDATHVLQFLFNMFKASFNDKVDEGLRVGIHSHATTCLDTHLVKTLLDDIIADLVQRGLSATGLV